jgi:thiamine biosynthesis lipoprotein
MGTLLDITLFHHDDDRARRLLNQAFSLAERLDGLLSNYEPESEVNRLNRRAGRGKLKVSTELYAFLRTAKSLSQKTEGAFDITVRPLVELWREADEKKEFPSTHKVRAARSLTAYRQMVIHPHQEVELAREGMCIETGGLGKGYAVDQIAGLLIRRGVKSALINFGHSSIRAVGSPPGQTVWKLLLQFPNDKPLGVLELKDQALSASDTFGGPVEIGKSGFGHIIDPETGQPITERVQAVILGPSAADAEALSKYIILRGPKTRKDLQVWGPVQILRVAEKGETERSDGFPLNEAPVFGEGAQSN